MRFRVEIECDNAAFGGEEDSEKIEVARILRWTIEHLYQDDFKLLDYYGNTVGRAWFED